MTKKNIKLVDISIIKSNGIYNEMIKDSNQWADI